MTMHQTDPLEVFQRIAENAKSRDGFGRICGLEECRAEWEALLDRQLRFRERLRACRASSDLLAQLSDGPIVTSHDFLASIADEIERAG